MYDASSMTAVACSVVYLPDIDLTILCAGFVILGGNLVKRLPGAWRCHQR